MKIFIVCKNAEPAELVVVFELTPIFNPAAPNVPTLVEDRMRNWALSLYYGS